jgi:hypothetical protein
MLQFTNIFLIPYSIHTIFGVIGFHASGLKYLVLEMGSELRSIAPSVFKDFRSIPFLSLNQSVLLDSQRLLTARRSLAFDLIEILL